MPLPIRSLSKLDEPKFRFQNLCPSKVIEENLGGGRLDPPGIRTVNVNVQLLPVSSMWPIGPLVGVYITVGRHQSQTIERIKALCV